MAQVSLALIIETELLHDAARALAGLLAGLSHRHGERFRRLEREIEKAFESVDAPDVEWLDGGRGVAILPRAWTECLRQGAALGVAVEGL